MSNQMCLDPHPAFKDEGTINDEHGACDLTTSVLNPYWARGEMKRADLSALQSDLIRD